MHRKMSVQDAAIIVSLNPLTPLCNAAACAERILSGTSQESLSFAGVVQWKWPHARLSDSGTKYTQLGVADSSEGAAQCILLLGEAVDAAICCYPGVVIFILQAGVTRRSPPLPMIQHEWQIRKIGGVPASAEGLWEDVDSLPAAPTDGPACVEDAHRAGRV